MKLLAVETLALDRAVEALDPSVRPGVVWLGPRVADPQGRGSLVEGALVSRAVVGEHPPHADAPRVERCERALQEADGVGVPTAGTQLGDDQAARKIDRDRKSTRLNSSHGYISYA